MIAKARITLVATALLVVGLAGCGSDSKSTTSGNPTFKLNEFSVTLDRATLPSGKITITAQNIGGEEHELVLIKVASIGDLPTKADGSIDEEKIPESAKVGEIPEVKAGTSKSVAFDLAPGTYVAMCNLVDQMTHGAAGPVHFVSGMHEVVTVK